MQLDSILQQSLELIKDTGRFIQEEAAKFSHTAIEYKGKNDLVSYVDKASEKKLVAGLAEILPESGFITEEGTATKGRTDKYNWVIDPVDGTTNFVHGIPIYCISVALMDGDEVIMGIIYDPCRDEMFYSAKGMKAYLNDQPISVSPVKELSESLLASGFPYSKFHSTAAYIQVVEELMPKTHGLRRMGSAAIDLAYVACGRFEGFFEYNLKPWDVAAGAFLVQQADGKVTTFKSTNDYIFGGELVAGCAIQSELREIIQKHWYSA